MKSKVAILEFDENHAESLSQALRLIGGIDDLSATRKPVVVKVGVFSARMGNHTSIEFVRAIADSFKAAPKVFLAESDNYQGTASERLQIWNELFTERVVPFNLSTGTETRKVSLAGQQMELSDILFKPTILVDTHILRTFKRGSILKNLFGCIPTPKKAKYHKILPALLADIYEALGGIDLAVLDGTHFWRGAGAVPVRMNTLLVARDAVALEAVGASLAGLHPEKMPVIQEFVKRGLGEGDFENIEIVGASFESLKVRFKAATKLLEKRWLERGGASKIWSQAIDSLIKSGFFKPPGIRTREDVGKALEKKSIDIEGKAGVIATTLNRRAAKGVLKAKKGADGRIYWTE